MRPKKRVLLYCQDGLNLSMTAFVLWSRAYQVTTCSGDSASADILDTWTGDCVVLLEGREPDRCEQFVSEIKERLPDTKVGLVLSHAELTASQADVVMFSSNNEGLLGMVRDLCVRRRGPKPVSIVHREEVTA
jgi:hypothetical protein